MHKILYLHSSNELYGADRSLLRMASLVDRNVFQPYVILPNDISYEGLLSRALSEKKIPVMEMSLGVLRRKYFSPFGLLRILGQTLSSSVRMSRYLRSEGFSLVHSNTTAVMSGGVAARLAGVPHVWHVREIIQQPKWLNTFFAHSLNLFATRVVAVSGPVKENLVRTQPGLADKTVVIHNGIDPSAYDRVSGEEISELRQSWGANQGSVVIGMVGRISSWKGQAFFLNAAAELVKNYPGIRIVLVGGDVPGESRLAELTQLVQQLGMKDHVCVDDFRLDIPCVLSSFDIFVLPSTRPDPFPTVVLEAMAVGKPVVATRHGGAIEQVADGASGFLVSPQDPGEMAAALARLVESPELRLKMGEAGRKRLLEHFRVEQHIRAVEDLYAHILKHEA